VVTESQPAQLVLHSTIAQDMVFAPQLEDQLHVFVTFQILRPLTPAQHAQFLCVQILQHVQLVQVTQDAVGVAKSKPVFQET